MWAVWEELHNQFVLAQTKLDVSNNIWGQPRCPEVLEFPDSVSHPIFAIAKEQERIKDFPNVKHYSIPPFEM